MNIYFTGDKIIREINSKGIHAKHDTGWGNLTKYIKRSLSNHTFVDDIHKADIELFVGQPHVYPNPQMSPSIIYTMYEWDKMPSSWVSYLKNWDIVLNPTQWGASCFLEQGIKTSLLNPPIYFNDYIPRTTDDWTYYCQAKYLQDRKQADMIAMLFKDELPEYNLVAKTVPPPGMPDFDLRVSENVRIVQSMMTIEGLQELYTQCQVSINPSLREGIGLIIIESMASGMCTLYANYSSLTEVSEVGIPIPVVNDTIEEEELIQAIRWCDKHKEEALDIGKKSSAYVREKFLPDKFLAGFEKMELSKPKVRREWHTEDKLEDWLGAQILSDIRKELANDL